MTDQGTFAFRRIRDWEYRTQYLFLRDQLYLGNFHDIHVDANGAATGSTFTPPSTQTFWFVAAQVSNLSGGTKTIELQHAGIDLETIELPNAATEHFVLPIDAVNGGETIAIVNTSGAGDWHSSMYGYTEASTKILHATLD